MSTAYWPFNRAFDFGSFDLGMRIIVKVIIPMFSFCGVEHMAFFSGGSFHGPFMELCHGIKIWWASTSQVPGSQWKVYNKRDRGISMIRNRVGSYASWELAAPSPPQTKLHLFSIQIVSWPVGSNIACLGIRGPWKIHGPPSMYCHIIRLWGCQKNKGCPESRIVNRYPAANECRQ